MAKAYFVLQIALANHIDLRKNLRSTQGFWVMSQEDPWNANSSLLQVGRVTGVSPTSVALSECLRRQRHVGFCNSLICVNSIRCLVLLASNYRTPRSWQHLHEYLISNCFMFRFFVYWSGASAPEIEMAERASTHLPSTCIHSLVLHLHQPPAL